MNSGIKLIASSITAMVFVLVLGVFMPVTLQASEISVSIEGELVNFEGQGPVIVDGRTLVPVRGVFEALGFEVEWDEVERTVILHREGHLVAITVDSEAFITNARNYTLDVPAQIINDRTMLPIRLVLESVGYNVGWDESTRTVTISAYEIGKHFPSFSSLLDMSRLFGASLDYIMGLSVIKKPISEECLPNDEVALLSLYQSLSLNQKEKAIAFIKGLCSS